MDWTKRKAGSTARGVNALRTLPRGRLPVKGWPMRPGRQVVLPAPQLGSGAAFHRILPGGRG
ncbi:MAG: hypothetical protein ACR2HZ_09400 [Gemmatimonadaceae bacterium]